MNRLDTATFRGNEYFIDRRLKQLRAVDNPHEWIDFRKQSFVAYQRFDGSVVLFTTLIKDRIARKMHVTYKEILCAEGENFIMVD